MLHPYLASLAFVLATSASGAEAASRPEECTLRGLVSAEPVTAVLVTVTRADVFDGPVRSVITDEDGGFEVAVADSGPWRISTAAPGMIPAHVVTACDGQSIELALMPGDAPVDITVKGEDTKPIAGAVIVLSTVGKADVEPDPEVLTVPKEGLSFAVERGPTFRVAAGAPNHGSDATEFVSAESDDLRLQFFLPRLRAVAGVVRNAQGEPIAGALVARAPTEHEPAPELTRTGLDGTFMLVTDPHEQVSVVARANDGVASVEVDPDGPGASSVVLVLTPGTTVDGHLVDETEHDIAGRVMWHHVDSGLQGEVVTGPDGAFEIHAIPIGGMVELWASDGAYHPIRSTDRSANVVVPFLAPDRADGPVKKAGG